MNVLRRRMSLPTGSIIPACAAALATPCLLVDLRRVERNIQDLNRRIQKTNCFFRPHMKTTKSAGFASMMTAGHTRAICVSTVAEIEYFANYGYMDIQYAVGIAADKLPLIVAAMQRHPELVVTIITDSVAGAEQIVSKMESIEQSFKGKEDSKPIRPIRVLIEIDVGHGRSGIPPSDDALVPIAKTLLAANPEHVIFRGVLTHAGQGYNAKSKEDLLAVCEAEHKGILEAAKNLEAAGIECSITSMGSSPTATHHTAATTKDVVELRAGVYPLFDLDQVGIGSCKLDDVAMTVLATVVSHNKTNGRVIIDAGGLALSKDISASKHESMAPTGYGWVVGHPEVYVSAVSQEHGMITVKDPKEHLMPWEEFPIGSKVRVIPNHACITAAGHDCYYVYDPTDEDIPCEKWGRINGYI